MTDEQHDTEAHLYIPKDERANNDAEGHGYRGPDDGSGATDDDTESHGFRGPDDGVVVVTVR